MKVFISIPMKGRSDIEIKKEMNLVANAIKMEYGDHIEIIDSFIADSPPDNAGRDGVWYLAKSIEMLGQAQLAVFIGEWKTARGCIVEHQVATLYNIPILYYAF